MGLRFLEERLELLAAIADRAPLAACVLRVPGGDQVYANRLFARLLGPASPPGPSLEESALKAALRRRTGEAYPFAELLYARAVETGEEVAAGDLLLRCADGHELPVRASATPLPAADGRVGHILLALADASAEAAMRREREHAEETTRSMLEWAPVLYFSQLLFFATDRQGVLQVADGRGLESFGADRSLLVGRSIFELFPTPELRAAVQRCLAGESFTEVVNLGSHIAHAALWPRRGAQHDIVGAMGVALDITEQERMRRQLVQADRMAALGTLAAGVGHEVNTPLTYALAHLDLLERGLASATREERELRERLQRHLAAAQDGVGRVSRIVRDLNTFSRQHSEERRTLDPREPLRSAVALLRSQMSLQRVELLESYEDTPLVDGDASRLAQVFLNLLLNAAQALPTEESARREIRVRASRGPGGEAVFEVTDTGTGIRPGDLEHIFEPFFTTKPVGVGTGLGLSVSLNIVRAFGGDLSVVKTGRDGTVFRVRLPASTQARQQPAAPTLQPMPARRPRVLVIDDDVNLARVFVLVLKDECIVEAHTDPRKGLAALLAGEPYDLILCDVMMRELSAMELYEQLKRERPGMERRLVLMTGGAFSKDAREFLSSVPNLCLTKPFDVRKAVSQALQSGLVPFEGRGQS